MSILPKQPKLANRKYVGSEGDFRTLKDAVDWFNTSATVCTELVVDAGRHYITDTITVDSAIGATLLIRGLGSSSTRLTAHTGLASKPMFIVKTSCDFNRLMGEGSLLAAYGTLAGENFITFGNTGAIYTEITDVILDNFNIGISDPTGADWFMFNFIVSNCAKGVAINHTNITMTTMDAEVGNFEDCAIGVDLVNAGSASFILRNLIFMNPALGIGIKYDGDNYILGDFSEIGGCSCNNIGDFVSGFDFSRPDGRDANIIAVGNINLEDKKPHCKINVIDNAATTTVAAAGTYYKANGINSLTRIAFDVAASAGTFTITVDDQTTAGIAWNAATADIKSALEALSNVTTVTVAQITASKEWTIRFDTVGEGWVDQSCNISGLTTTTAVDVIKSFYTCKMTLDQNRMTYQPSDKKDSKMLISGNAQVGNNNRNVTLGIKSNNTGRILSPMTVRCQSAGVPYSFSLIAYIEDVVQNDYFEIFLTSSTNGDVVTIQDLNWYFESR